MDGARQAVYVGSLRSSGWQYVGRGALALSVALMFVCSARKLFAVCMPTQFATMELTRNSQLRHQSDATHVER